MIEVTRHKFSNGLTLLHHHNTSTVMAALVVMYDVGSRDEVPGATGIAHLTEHLMFSGSRHVPDFDDALQRAGGVSNAWTSCDETIYYCVLPAVNIETAFWLESDRMLHLNLDDESINTQRSVVIEEFKQQALNVPYGDVEHLLLPLAYRVHPYRWPVLGRTVEELERVDNDRVRAFHDNHYDVSRATVCVSGNVPVERAISLTERWFGDIEPRALAPRQLPAEPLQQEHRALMVERHVPATAIYRAYHMPARADAAFYASDLLSDVLANGQSSRFFKHILSNGKVFTELDASVGGTIDPGLFYIRGRLCDNVNVESAMKLVDDEISRLQDDGPSQYEVDKYTNKALSHSMFENVDYMARAIKLCQMEHTFSDANFINAEEARYRAVTPDDVLEAARTILRPANCSTLAYTSTK